MKSMKKHPLNQSGVAHILLVLLLVVVVGVVGYSAFRVLESKNKSITSENSAEKAANNSVKIKSLGIDIDYYDPQTNQAGDIVFMKDTFQEGSIDRVFMEYGYTMAGNSANNFQDRSNPQPTFLLPVGTKVQSLVDGVVENVSKLYSGDYSVMVKGKGSDLIFETEHVMNVTVKAGDTVKGGQVIAEVSDYDAKNYGGKYSLLDIGVLQGGNPPRHVCLSDYLDDSIKDETLKKITALKKSWEEYRGDPTIYDESSVLIPGCVSREPIEGWLT